MKPSSPIPLATYRLQLNREFTFAQATAIVPYLSAIGISHCYISPCLKARPGSMHGYDIVDHNSFNPEIGSAKDFDYFVSVLHDHGMGLIVDIVPNHMGVMGSDNAWWLDVLENGESSVYAGFFDIDWRPLKEELHGKVLIPVLHDHYGAVLESGELKLVFNQERGEFDVWYRNNRFPVGPREYPRVLQPCGEALKTKLPPQDPNLLEFQSLVTAFGHLPARKALSAEEIAERNRDKEIHKRRLAELCARFPELSTCISQVVEKINGNPADPASFEELHELIKAQTFRLANWRVASDDINYRRFFDTNDLAGICVEHEEVFEATHRLILKLVEEGKVDGLRIDHPDGLYDPASYFARLNRGMATATNKTQDATHFVIIEKILMGAERLPAAWPVCGTTGYDFSNLVNGLFVDARSVGRMERIYRNFAGDEVDLDDLAYRCRRLIIRVALASELNVLASQITRIALSKRRTCDFTLNSLRDALTEVVANFPVYRTYVTASSVSETDTNYIRGAIASAKLKIPAADLSIFDFIGEVLLTRIAEGQDAAYRNAVVSFAMKFQQFTGPVMAKGLEDTTFYRYHRLISLNDVGSDLHRFGTTVSEFHNANRERLRDWPHTILASSTHDSKRSEDVRARINVISEIPALWRLRVRVWRDLNRGYKRKVNDKRAPSSNDEYLLYQTLVGAWPLEPLTEKRDLELFSSRIESYMLKAIREAKQNTSWINPNQEYEAAVSSFVKTLLAPDPGNSFRADFLAFQSRIARMGLWNSLSQTLLKLTCPGVPDVYQGNDLWDFSLVDPDNRRPVDYARRRHAFGSLGDVDSVPDTTAIHDLLATPQDGRLKLYVTWKTLCFRKEQPELFAQGDYVPLEVEGAKGEHLVGFMRRLGDRCVLVTAPRLIAGLLADSQDTAIPTGDAIWQDTQVVLPSGTNAATYQNVLTGEILEAHSADGGAKIPVSSLLAEFPVALWRLV